MLKLHCLPFIALSVEAFVVIILTLKTFSHSPRVIFCMTSLKSSWNGDRMSITYEVIAIRLQFIYSILSSGRVTN